MSKNINLPKWSRCPKTGDNISGLTENGIGELFSEIRPYDDHPRQGIAHNTEMGARFVHYHEKGITRKLTGSGTPEGAKAYIEGAKVFCADFIRVIEGGEPVPRSAWEDNYEPLANFR